jgi:protein-S-isoprenylcysteine O-methyltransferase Ste14
MALLDWPYRLAVMLQLAAYVPIGVFHRLRSRQTGERLDRRREGWGILIALRLSGLVMAVSTLVYVLRPSLVGWAQVGLPPAVRWAGAPLALAGAAVFAATLRALGRNLTDTVVTRKDHTLVTSGPYRWVRHPFYLSALLGGLGTALLSASLLILGATLVVYGLLVVRTPIEEGHLAERFGESYEDYRRRVPPFWPRPPRAR